MKEESQARVARISGAGHLPGGEYESIHISGSAKIDGDAVCQEDVHVSGAATAKGDLAAKEIHVSGSLQVEGDVHAEAVRVSGSAHVAGGMEVCGEMRVSGSAHICKAARIQQLRAAVKQRHHIDTEGRLKLGQLEEIIADRFRVSVAPELDHDTDFLRGLIPEIHNAVDLLLAPEGRDLLDQFGLVHHVGEFVHNDRRMSLVIGFVVHLGADQHGTAAGAVRLTDTAETENDAASREIRSREETDQVIHARRRVMQRVEARINCFSEVMRRDVRRHADRDTLAAIHQQLREAGGQHRRFFFCTVKVRHKIHDILVKVR